MRGFRVALAAGCLVLAAMPAEATVTLIKITGTLDYGTDALGYFGAGEDIGGLVATLTFRVDDQGQLYLGETADQSSAASYSFAHPDPAVTATVTVNGHVLAVDTHQQTRGLVLHQKNQVHPFAGLIRDTFTATVDWGGANHSEAIYYDLSSKTQLFANPDWRQFLDFEIPDDIFSSRAGFSFFHDGVTTVGEFMTGHITTEIEAEAPSPTPEPAAWAMMLVGFGAVGGMLRGRRRARVGFG